MSDMPAASFDENHPSTVLARAVAELELKTAAALGTWGLGAGGEWEADLDAGTIMFSGGGKPTATAAVQVIGTFSTEEDTFLWAWDHPSIPDALARDAKLVRDFGVRHGLKDLTTRKVTCTEEDAGKFTALACYLAKAQGAYVGPAGPTLVYMTFGVVSVSY